jgi:hypothetical protein
MSIERKSKSANKDGEILLELLKEAKIYNDQDGNPKWRIKVVDVPKNVQFADYKPIDFMGYAFIKKETGDIYLNPPKEVVNLLKDDKKHIVKNEEKISSLEDQYGSDGTDLFYGYYKISSDKKSSIEKMEYEIELDSIDLNRSDMRELSLRKIAEFLVQEIPPEALLACVTSQIQYINYMDNNALSQIAEVLETIKPKFPEKKANKEIIEDEEDVIRQNELKESITTLEKLLKNPDNTEEKNNTIEKQLKKLKKELTNGFGSSSLQSNRGILRTSMKNLKKTPKMKNITVFQKKRTRLMKNLRSKKKKRISKSPKRSLIARTKMIPALDQFRVLVQHQTIKQIQMTKNNRSNKKYLNLKMRKHRSKKYCSKKSRSKKIKRRSRKTRSFGSSSIYGLQNARSYNGSYQPIFPNLDNVIRDYRN